MCATTTAVSSLPHKRQQHGSPRRCYKSRFGLMLLCSVVMLSIIYIYNMKAVFRLLLLSSNEEYDGGDVVRERQRQFAPAAVAATAALSAPDQPNVTYIMQHDAQEVMPTKPRETRAVTRAINKRRRTIIEPLHRGNEEQKQAPPKKKRQQPRKGRRGYRPISDDPRSQLLGDVVYGCNSTSTTTWELEIHVFGWKRPTQLQILLNQLLDANYDPGLIAPTIQLHVHVDGSKPTFDDVSMDAWKETVKLARSFRETNVNNNNSMDIHIDIQSQNIGLRQMWLTSLRKATVSSTIQDNEKKLLLVLEDDTAISPLYYQYIQRLLQKYYHNPCRDSNNMGFSLSPIKLHELQKPFRRWYSHEAMQDRSHHSVYLTTVPSSWGAIYFADKWKEFDDFVQLRIQEPFYSIHQETTLQVTSYDEYEGKLTPLQLPNNTRSNVWPNSWKRFMIDFMYGRGYVMMYPNILNEVGLATTLVLPGEHVKDRIGKKLDPKIAELMVGNKDALDSLNLPRYGDLTIFDLFLQKTTKEELAMKGSVFLHSIWNEYCQQGQRSQQERCMELVNEWKRPGSVITSSSKPLLCAPDLYTSVTDERKMERQQAATTNEQFLLYEPEYGGNNQIFALVQAQSFAKLLNRTLIVPPILLPRARDYVASDDLNRNNPFSIHSYNRTIGFQEYAEQRHPPPTRIVRLSRDADPKLDRPTQLLTTYLYRQHQERQPVSSEAAESEPFIVNVRHLSKIRPGVSAAEFIHYFGGCQDPVLTFQGVFFTHIVGFDKLKELPNALSLSPQTKGIVEQVQSNMIEKMGASGASSPQKYSCYHVRRGDFAQMCEGVKHNPNRSNMYVRNLAEGFSCLVTKEQFQSLLAAMTGTPIMVMTDDSDWVDDTVPEERKASVVTSRWIQEQIDEEVTKLNSSFRQSEADMRMLSMVVEQELCARADVVILSKYSTVSKRVESLRRMKTIGYWTHTTKLR